MTILEELMARARQPSTSEDSFFRGRPDVAGMATEDNRITLSPYRQMRPEEKDSVLRNEAVRLFLRLNPQLHPNFSITPQQEGRFANYGTAQDIRDTISARLFSGDPSAGSPTNEQSDFIRLLTNLLFAQN